MEMGGGNGEWMGGWKNTVLLKSRAALGKIAHFPSTAVGKGKRCEQRLGRGNDAEMWTKKMEGEGENWMEKENEGEGKMDLCDWLVGLGFGL